MPAENNSKIIANVIAKMLKKTAGKYKNVFFARQNVQAKINFINATNAKITEIYEVIFNISKIVESKKCW